MAQQIPFPFGEAFQHFARDHASTNMLIVNDTIIQAGMKALTPKETAVRNALLYISQTAPIFTSILVLLIQQNWWLAKYKWTYARMASFWFLSVAIVGLFLHFQEGYSNRTTFVVAAFHMLVEVFIIALFCKFSGFQAAAAGAIWGIFAFGGALFLSDVGQVFMWIAPIGGAGDFAQVLLLAYGKEWLYATGALAHLVAALTVFVSISVNVGSLTYSRITFFALYTNLSAMTAAIFRAYGQRNAAEAKGEDVEKDLKPGEAIDNPLQDSPITLKAFVVIAAISFASSTVTAYVLAYVLPPYWLR